jgi:2-oxoglutarate dehydrogenase E2 component (dihydrolipoamide succinyltransferase)
MMAEKGITAEQIGNGSAKDGRIAKGDVLDFLSRPAPQQAPTPAARAPRTRRRARSG